MYSVNYYYYYYCSALGLGHVRVSVHDGIRERAPPTLVHGRIPMSLLQVRYEDEDEDEGPQPDATLEQGAPLPVRLVGTFPPELASVPLEDIDPYYHNQKVSSTHGVITLSRRRTMNGRPLKAVGRRTHVHSPAARHQFRR